MAVGTPTPSKTVTALSPGASAEKGEEEEDFTVGKRRMATETTSAAEWEDQDRGYRTGGVGQGMGAILASASRTTNSVAGTKGARGGVTVREVRAVRVRVRVRAVRVRVRVISIGIRDTKEGKAR